MNLKQIKTAMLPAALMLVMLLCGGCGDPANYDLPAQPQEFKVVDFTNPDLNTDAYASVEYNGRSYIPLRNAEPEAQGRGCRRLPRLYHANGHEG